MLTDGRTTDAGVTGILIAHLGAFGSGELKMKLTRTKTMHPCKFPTTIFFVVETFKLKKETYITLHSFKSEHL